VRQTGYSNSSLDMAMNMVANMPITNEPKIAAIEPARASPHFFLLSAYTPPIMTYGPSPYKSQGNLVAHLVFCKNRTPIGHDVTSTHFVTFISNEKEVFSYLRPCRHPDVHSSTPLRVAVVVRYNNRRPNPRLLLRASHRRK